jgi:hypothetical protein
LHPTLFGLVKIGLDRFEIRHKLRSYWNFAGSAGYNKLTRLLRYIGQKPIGIWKKMKKAPHQRGEGK